VGFGEVEGSSSSLATLAVVGLLAVIELLPAVKSCDCRVILGGRVVAGGRNISCHYPSRVPCFIPDFVLDVGLSKEVINSCLIKVKTESLVNHLRF
jgi:hypothetical protein